jgi:hypothetical protein
MNMATQGYMGRASKT